MKPYGVTALSNLCDTVGGKRETTTLEPSKGGIGKRLKVAKNRFNLIPLFSHWKVKCVNSDFAGINHIITAKSVENAKLAVTPASDTFIMSLR